VPVWQTRTVCPASRRPRAIRSARRRSSSTTSTRTNPPTLPHRSRAPTWGG